METETGALSVEDAVARLTTEEAVDDQPNDQQHDEADEGSEGTEPGDPAIGDDGDTDPAEGDAGEDDDQSGDDEPAEPAIEAPKSWDAEHREKFAALPRDVQEYLVARETERDKGVSVAQQRASEARQQAEREFAAVTSLKPQIEGLLGQARQHLDRWSGMDATAWKRAAEQMDPREFNLLRAEHDADVQRVQQLEAARHQAEAVEYADFSQKQTARLAEVAPHLADQKAQAEVFDYIAKNVPNATPETAKWISADEFLIAWKAAQYDAAQAPKPKPQGKKAAPAAKPGAPPIPQKQRRASDLDQRFARTNSINDAVALLNSRG